MSEAVHAAELLGGNPPAPKQRPPWPPEVPWVEAFKNCGYARHPIDKRYIGKEKAALLGCKIFHEFKPELLPPPEPSPTPTTPPPPPPPQPEHEPENLPHVETDRPDFSRLPSTDDEQPRAPGTEEQPEMSEHEAQAFYERIASYCWDTWVSLFVMLVGDFWKPQSKEERDSVISAFVFYFKSIALRAWTPFQTLMAAIAMYCVPRLPATVQTLWKKWRSRKEKKSEANEPEQPEHPQPQSIINLGPGE